MHNHTHSSPLSSPNRNNNDVIAKMNVLFDKATYEKGRSLDTNNNKLVDEKDEGKSIEMAIKESLADGKVGSLSVDPDFLEFEPLASEYIYPGVVAFTNVTLSLSPLFVVVSTEKSTTSRIAEYFQLSEVRLYTVLGCIAALILVAIIQATCTIMKTSKKTKRHKVSHA
jgi:hypothetical protein